jgi:anti-sigma-K factor RskA
MSQDLHDLHDLAPVYALDALPDDEHAFFERHLDACEACREEVREHREVAAALGEATAEPLPDGFRDRLLTQVDATSQEMAPVPPRAASTPPARFRPLAAVAAALLVAVLGMGGVTAYLLGEAAGPSQVALDPAFLAVAEAIRLEAPAGAAATFYRSDEHDEGWLVVAGLDELDPDLAYQLWLFHDGTPVPAGVFEGDGSSAVLLAEAQVRDAELVAVTVEPAGGLPAPSGPIVMSAQL